MGNNDQKAVKGQVHISEKSDHLYIAIYGKN